MLSEEEIMKEMVGGCCVCSDERGWDENPLVYCDGVGCNVAVHQACYGIVTVPSGPWFCRKCESQERAARVKLVKSDKTKLELGAKENRCELCPSKDGALKRTDQNGWAHVVCALYIPEVRFGNVTTMEPILISLIPTERFGRTCCICETNNRSSKATVGACMQCNKPGCKQNFHVTCAQMQGLLCEEAGNMDNVKYCGYCQYHYGKLMKNYKNSMLLVPSQKTTRNVKIIPPFRPVASSSSNANVESPSSSPEKPGNKGSSSSVALSDEIKNSNTSGTAVNSQRSTVSTTGNGHSGDSKKSNNSSPDVDSSTNSSKNSKNPKKGSIGYSGGVSGNNKSTTEGSTPAKSVGNASIIPKIAQPVLTAATFSSSNNINKSATSERETTGSEEKSEVTPVLVNNKNKTGNSDTPVKSSDDSLTIKLERVDNPLLKGSTHNKKDFTTLQLKEVVTAALDRPMSSAGSKFDHVSAALTGGIEPPMSSISSTSSTGSHSSARPSHHGEKLPPPDIKPHVTLTPIPMRGSTTRMSLSRGDKIDEKDEKEKEASGKTKSPVTGTLSFHNSFGPPKLQNQSQSHDSSGDKAIKLPDLSSQSEIPALDKAGPPAKRSRGASRDEERDRKTPTKGRGGRRGAAAAAYAKRETSNGSFVDENSHDDPMEGHTSSSKQFLNEPNDSTRGGRSGPGRKPGSSRLGRPPADDPPAPTLSQLKSQMESNAAESTISVLPTHMFGNALNPASSMAQRMVDTLSQEMEAVVAAGAGGIPDIISAPTPLVGISLPGKSTTTQATTNGSATTHSGGSVPPQTLEQLLERQWEQGSQFLMEQAQHLDVAQLLSCLNQLKQDNRALEEHVQSLVQRKDQLIAINARLSIPLGSSSALGPLGPGFNNPANGTSLNGHNGTPPPTLQPQALLHSSGGTKNLQVSSSTPSPQQQHEMMIQSSRHGHRDDRGYPHVSEMQVSRAEITVAHPTQSPHSGHPGHSHGHHRGPQAPYGYSGHVPVVTNHPSSHQSSHQHPSHGGSHHPQSRDSQR